MEQMDTVTTEYVDLRKKFVQWEYTCRARQYLMLPWKQNMFAMLANNCRYFTVVCCRYPHSTASCHAWSEFFMTIWPGLYTIFDVIIFERQIDKMI